MKNGMAIGGICRQMAKICERIDTMTMDMEQFENNASDDVLEIFKQHRIDELAHIQELTLALTAFITEAGSTAAANVDDSAFVSGDLNHTKEEAKAP